MTPVINGQVARVSDLPTPNRPYDFAIFELKHLEGLATRALSDIARLLVDGGRIVFFSDDYLKSAEIVQVCVIGGLRLEQVLVRAISKEPLSLFEPCHEYIFVLRKGKKAIPRETAVYGHLNGYPGSVWHGDVAFAAGILFRAYTSPGNKVLCPAGGTELIAISLTTGNETHYLCKTQEKLEYYESVFTTKKTPLKGVGAH